VISRSLLPARPTRGTRQLTWWPVYLTGVVLGLVIIVIVYTYQQKLNQQQAISAPDAREAQGAGSHAKDIITVPSEKPPAPSKPATPPETTAEAHPAPPAPVVINAAEQARVKAWQAYYEHTMPQEMQAKAEQATKAYSVDTSIDLGGGASQGGAQNTGVTNIPPGLAGSGFGPYGLNGSHESETASTIATGQAEKRDFLAKAGDPLGMNEDLVAVAHKAKPDTIMAGTPIQGVMIGGMTSDSPGMVIGQVAQDVCDTATGAHLLIPWGTRAIGIYDNSVSNGQTRIGVIWNRLVFPDTQSLQLGSMEGADQGGYAGFHDQVDTHFWDKFGSAILLSVAGAAVQLSQPKGAVGGTYNSEQVAAAALGQQMAVLGGEYARAGLAIPNTLEIRPGYIFEIMVHKDIHLQPYMDQRGITRATQCSADDGLTLVHQGPILQ